LDKLIELPYGLEGTIYRSPLPFSLMFDPAQTVMDAYLRAGVDTVVMLTPEEEARGLTGRDLRREFCDQGFEVIYAPVMDFSVPEEGVFQTAIPKTLQTARGGKTIVVHCHAGIGRTGMFAACLARVVFDMTGDEAVAWVREYVPHAVENQAQYQFVKSFEMTGD
jgi:protein-tyrosine phosphatase